MAIHGWEHYDLENEMAVANFAQLLELFKRESGKYSGKCMELVKNLGVLTEEGRALIEKEAAHLDEARMKLSLRIAEIMTDTKMR